MKKRIYYILTIILCLMGGAATTYAQTEGLSPIEHTDKEGNTESIYVIYVSPVGSATNLGDSWKTAKNDLQTAIDVLNEISTVKEGKTRGYVFVAGSNYNAATKTGPTLTSVTYKPTSLVSSSNTSPTHKSFCIYPNIYVIGGFKGDETVPKSGDADYDKTHKYCEWEKDLPKMRWLNIGTADSIRSGDLMNLHDDFDEEEIIIQIPIRLSMMRSVVCITPHIL